MKKDKSNTPERGVEEKLKNAGTKLRIFFLICTVIFSDFRNVYRHMQRIDKERGWSQLICSSALYVVL